MITKNNRKNRFERAHIENKQLGKQLMNIDATVPI